MAHDLLSAMESDEGFRSTVYKDSVGKATIGFGFLVEPGSAGLSRDECLMILKGRLAKLRYDGLPKALPWIQRLNGPRQEVLVNMAYNLGVGGLLKFKRTLAYARAGARASTDLSSSFPAQAKLFAASAAELLDSKWAKQVGDRAIRLAKQMETGERQ